MPSRKELEAALEAIEEISACAQSTDPQRDWKLSQEAVCEIYRIAHWVRAPGCRKNHPDFKPKELVAGRRK